MGNGKSTCLSEFHRSLQEGGKDSLLVNLRGADAEQPSSNSVSDLNANLHLFSRQLGLPERAWLFQFLAPPLGTIRYSVDRIVFYSDDSISWIVFQRCALDKNCCTHPTGSVP
jgi:hypothetical protein